MTGTFPRPRSELETAGARGVERSNAFVVGQWGQIMVVEWLQVVLGGGSRWLQVVIGCRWSYIVLGGYRWLQVVIGGCRWLQVVIGGSRWLQFIGTDGYRWLQVVVDCANGSGLFQMVCFIVLGLLNYKRLVILQDGFRLFMINPVNVIDGYNLFQRLFLDGYCHKHSSCLQMVFNHKEHRHSQRLQMI